MDYVDPLNNVQKVYIDPLKGLTRTSIDPVKVFKGSMSTFEMLLKVLHRSVQGI